MCTTTNAEINDEPRPISTLLTLETYQGMTDEEINMVIDYKIERAINSQEMLLREQTAIEYTNTRAQQNADAIDRAQSMVEYALGMRNDVPKTQHVRVSPRATEIISKRNTEV